MFSKFDLKISIESNLTKTDFLDVELHLINDSYVLFRKPNFQTTYISTKSNDPRYVVNQILKSINKRLTTISKDEYKEQKNTSRKRQLKDVISTSWYLTLKRSKVIKVKGTISCTSPHLFVQRLKQKSVNDSLKLLARTLTQRTHTITFLIGNC